MYRFYDPKYSKPKQVMVQGMNQFKSLSERQIATQKALVIEMDRLTKEGYNPFIKSQELSKDCDTINAETPILEALKSVYSKIEVSSRTKTDIKFMLSSVGWKIRSMYIIPFFKKIRPLCGK